MLDLRVTTFVKKFDDDDDDDDDDDMHRVLSKMDEELQTDVQTIEPIYLVITQKKRWPRSIVRPRLVAK